MSQSRHLVDVVIAVVLTMGAVLVITETNFMRPAAPNHQQRGLGALQVLGSSLEMYRRVKSSYPDNWQADMFPDSDLPFAPLDFNRDIQLSAQYDAYTHYKYLYTPLPVGCKEPNCTHYTLSAIPSLTDVPIWYRLRGTRYRSFFSDETGVVRHCVGSSGADATDPPIDEAPVKCR